MMSLKKMKRKMMDKCNYCGLALEEHRVVMQKNYPNLFHPDCAYEYINQKEALG